MAYNSVFKQVFLFLSVAFTAIVAVNATQVMHRPTNYTSAPHTFKTEKEPKTNVIHKRATAKVQGLSQFTVILVCESVSTCTLVAYFTNWGM